MKLEVQTISLKKSLIKNVLIKATALNGGITPKSISKSFELVFKGAENE